MDKLADGSEDEEMASDDDLRRVGSVLGSDDESEERKHKPAYVPPENIDLGDRWVLRDVKTDVGAHESDSGPGSDEESHSESGEHEDDDDAPGQSARVVWDEVSVRRARPLPLLMGLIHRHQSRRRKSRDSFLTYNQRLRATELPNRLSRSRQKGPPRCSPKTNHLLLSSHHLHLH